MKKEQFSRFYNMETRWYDEDMLGHINHGTAVAYFEDAELGTLTILVFFHMILINFHSLLHQ